MCLRSAVVDHAKSVPVLGRPAGWRYLSPIAAIPSPRVAEADVAAKQTWIWDGSTSTWTQVTANGAAGAPPGRRFETQGMAYDPNTQTVVMFGGFTFNNVAFGDTWLWNGTAQTWTLQNPATSPSARRTTDSARTSTPKSYG